MKARILLTAFLVCSIAFTLSAQQPPANTDNGPSLEVTMKFIKDKINQQGDIKYYAMDTEVVSGMVYSPTEYTVGFHVEAVLSVGGLFLTFYDVSPDANGTIETTTRNWKVLFKDIEKVEIITLREREDRAEPGITHQTNPEVYLLHVFLAEGKKCPRHIKTIKHDRRNTTTEQDDVITEYFNIFFRDQDSANRVATAINHAIDLCGGGEQSPF